MGKSYKKIFTHSLYIIIPLTISFIISSIIKCQFLIPATLIYGIMIVFMIPSDSFFSSSVDYNTKTVNPTYKKIIINRIEDKINFILVLLALIFCLFILYRHYT
jgi:hypothetical protein